MNIKKLIAVGSIVVLPFLLAACDYNIPGFSSNNKDVSTVTSQGSPATQTNQTTTVITFSSSGFSPSVVNAKVGDTIEFKNTSEANVQVNSAPHPTHELYPELNLGAIAPGASKTTSFSKAGIYRYHNHLNASQNGQIVVE